MPIVRADLPQGLSDETKEALRQVLKAAIVSALAPKETRYIYVALREVFAPVAAGIAAEDIYLLFRETPAENHYCGGTPLPNWMPADGVG